MISLLKAQRNAMTTWLWSLTIFTAIAIGVNGRFQSDARIKFLAANNGTDETFLNFCFHYDGQVSKIKGDAENGHRCEAKVHMKYTDRILSMDLCRRTFPFHIAHFITDGKVTKCFFDVYVKCDPGWVQIDHKCFQLQETKATADQAIEYCMNKTGRMKEEHPNLAQITKSVYSRFWEVTMSIWDSWMYVPTFEQYELEKTKDNTKGVAVLVMGAQNKYRGVGYERFATPPLTTMAEFMCQYTPVRTDAYYMHIMKQYASIYPNFLLGPKGMFTTSSRYGLIQTKEDPRRWSVKHFHDACKRVAMVFGGQESSGALFPSVELYDGEVLKGKQLVAPMVREDSCLGSSFSGVTYGGKPVAWNGNNKYKQWNTQMCNANSLIHTADGIIGSPMGYQSYIGCSLVKQAIQYEPCPDKWFTYFRKDGTVFCHLYLNEQRTWPDAQNRCRGMGAWLTGFEDEAEFLALKKNVPNYHYWIGAVATDGVISWQYGVAPNAIYAQSHISGTSGGCHSQGNKNNHDAVSCFQEYYSTSYSSVGIVCGRPASRTIVVSD